MKTEEKTTAPPNAAMLHAYIRHHHALGERLYGVVDAARDHELAFAPRDSFGQQIHSLFDVGAAPPSASVDERDDPATAKVKREVATEIRSRMADVGPVLVPIEFHSRYPYSGSEYLDLWAERLGTSAGILLLTEADPGPLATHLADLFRITDEEDHRYYFRFYDPRVLRLYLPTCTAAEAKEFLGPIRRILVESGTQGKMLSCSCGRSGVELKEKALDSSAKSSSPGRDRR